MAGPHCFLDIVLEDNGKANQTEMSAFVAKSTNNKLPDLFVVINIIRIQMFEESICSLAIYLAINCITC